MIVLAIVALLWWFFFGFKRGDESGLDRLVAVDWAAYGRRFWRNFRSLFGWGFKAFALFAGIWIAVRVIHWFWVTPIS